MRVELIYTPGCNSYKKLLDKLETVIAEERLPIPVHIVEAASASVAAYSATPTVRIDGDEFEAMPVEPQGEICRVYHGSQGLSSLPCIDALRDMLHRRWKDMTEAPLTGS